MYKISVFIFFMLSMILAGTVKNVYFENICEMCADTYNRIILYAYKDDNDVYQKHVINLHPHINNYILYGMFYLIIIIIVIMTRCR